MAVMFFIRSITSRFLYSVVSVFSVLTLTIPDLSYAQGILEEVVVTAQRREQSLQEVPISIHAVSGPELTRQGFRTMEDLGQFSPSVEMNESLHEHSVTIRGQGNDTAAMSVEQSAPIFVDGIHMGRPSMIKGAFMDVERVEVLTGPQPVYFGQNATAGAFSITTKKPTPSWEGDATAEIGNFGRLNFEGGIGGPITDTLGIRLAGQWDHTGGHLTDVYTGNTFPNRTDSGARVTLAWQPTDSFRGTAKLEYVRRRSDGDTNTVCLAPGVPDHENFSIMVPGEIPEFTDEIVQPPACRDGFEKIGVQEGTGRFPRPIDGINNDDARSGLLDIRNMARQVMPEGNLKSREPLDALHGRLSGLYELDNGIAIEGIVGWVDYERDTFESSDESPYLMEAAFRTELFDMYSGELRVTSPSGGTLEWSAGVYYQSEDLVMDPAQAVRANIRRPLRYHDPWQESEWKSVFGAITYNFFDNKASIDVGGRYTEVEKTGGLDALASTWIFDINPDPDGDGVIEATEHRPEENGGDRVHTDVAEAIIDCETGLTVNGGTPDTDMFGDSLWERQCGPYAGQAGFWTHEWRETDIPDAWDTMAPIDISQPIYGMKRFPGPFLDHYAEDSFDPQITLRYRPNQNHSLYVKYANAFKAGGFDTSDRGAPRGGLNYPLVTGDTVSFGEDGQKEFSYLAEHAHNYEIGARGNLFDSQLRYGVTVFYQKINDLQVETEIANLEQLLATGVAPTGRFLTNAGAQRNQGVEFQLDWAATDRLILNMAGVVQDSIMLEFIGGCTEFESLNADTTDCWSEEESIEIADNDSLEDLVDRAGYKAPRAPDWKVILGMDYQLPLFGNYIGRFNTKMAVSDGYTEDTLGFTRVIQWPTHADWNMLVGIGDADRTWDVNLYARNILQARQEYFEEFDDEMNVIYTDDMPQSAWFSYGLQFNYYYR